MWDPQSKQRLELSGAASSLQPVVAVPDIPTVEEIEPACLKKRETYSSLRCLGCELDQRQDRARQFDSAFLSDIRAIELTLPNVDSDSPKSRRGAMKSSGTARRGGNLDLSRDRVARLDYPPGFAGAPASQD
ncbi:MAG: hypothetical protein BGO23_13205 [Solirubrobacterales bacterium 67-14]|nr:MAG: hypothetical protein BGO23_13205 [Solirubrobacterales bacterium 67-14]